VIRRQKQTGRDCILLDVQRLILCLYVECVHFQVDGAETEDPWVKLPVMPDGLC